MQSECSPSAVQVQSKWLRSACVISQKSELHSPSRPRRLPVRQISTHGKPPATTSGHIVSLLGANPIKPTHTLGQSFLQREVAPNFGHSEVTGVKVSPDSAPQLAPRISAMRSRAWPIRGTLNCGYIINKNGPVITDNLLKRENGTVLTILAGPLWTQTQALGLKQS